MTCAFTGHRSQRLPWGSNETDPRCQALKTLLSAAVAQASGMGCRTFLCGMALGCDTYFAEAVLTYKELEPSVELTAIIPCADQADRWSEKDRRRYEGLLARCDRVQILEPSYSRGCMARRNRAMVDQSQVLISVFDGAPGGTAGTVQYAREKGLTLLPVWL